MEHMPWQVYRLLIRTLLHMKKKKKRKAFKDERKSAGLKMVQKRSHFENDEKRDELVENERAIANEHMLRSVTYYIYILYTICAIIARHTGHCTKNLKEM